MLLCWSLSWVGAKSCSLVFLSFVLLSELAPKLVDLGSRLSHVELGVYRICSFFSEAAVAMWLKG